MGVEEQKEEREVLESIFPDEITDVSETEFRISIQLEVTNDEGDNSEAPTIILNVQYLDAYPDEAPRLDITQPPNAPKHPYLDIQEDKAVLLSALDSTISENLGMAMVFTLVTTLKDSAELLISERQNAKQALKEIEAQKAEEEENRKFQGEAVTRESFLRWRESFRREMAEEELKRKEAEEAEDKSKKKTAKEEKKLTGKELWVRGLVGKIEEEDEGGDALDGMDKLKIGTAS
ncbi:RWD-domain-containing protein [Trematosphaeria pertusa]|uniref:RWD-domain-containing protein n=1 Tax=Trematosphaeria pertusa TaxID=390896 RepID=A0A6A6IZA5_9PLEO|nr:RWD-domain-containing protein [Trematosphaeria pertusa]KAF2255764.1 RWD-domain-containing protein [Trematosphaeria pertusa]